MLLSIMAMVIHHSEKRKREAPRERIRYGPIDERDKIWLEYLENKIWKNDVTCVDMLRLSKASFFHFCKLFRDRGLLQDTIHMCVEQQDAMFWDTVGHYTYVVLFFISMYCWIFMYEHILFAVFILYGPICCCNFIMDHCKCWIFMYELIYYLLKFCVTIL